MATRGTRETESPGGGRFDDAGDATRRTRLANERTYLAWWRTGLTAFAVALGAGKVVPELSDGTQWPYVALGIAFAVLGIACVAYAGRRHFEVEEAVRHGEFRPPDERIIVGLAGGGVVLGVLLVVVLAIWG